MSVLSGAIAWLLIVFPENGVLQKGLIWCKASAFHERVVPGRHCTTKSTGCMSCLLFFQSCFMSRDILLHPWNNLTKCLSTEKLFDTNIRSELKKKIGHEVPLITACCKTLWSSSAKVVRHVWLSADHWINAQRCCFAVSYLTKLWNEAFLWSRHRRMTYFSRTAVKVNCAIDTSLA